MKRRYISKTAYKSGSAAVITAVTQTLGGTDEDYGYLGRTQD